MEHNVIVIFGNSNDKPMTFEGSEFTEVFGRFVVRDNELVINAGEREAEVFRNRGIKPTNRELGGAVSGSAEKIAAR